MYLHLRKVNQRRRYIPGIYSRSLGEAGWSVEKAECLLGRQMGAVGEGGLLPPPFEGQTVRRPRGGEGGISIE